MRKSMKKIVGTIACAALLCTMTSCAMLDSAVNDLKGDLIGNSYVIETYDNYGNRVLTTSGDKINIEGNSVETTSYDSNGNTITGSELSSVVTINIDGKEIQSCGDTCITGIVNKYKNKKYVRQVKSRCYKISAGAAYHSVFR